MFMSTMLDMAITESRITSAQIRTSIKEEDQWETLTTMITIARVAHALDASAVLAHSRAKRIMHPTVVIRVTQLLITIVIHKASKRQRAIMDKVIQLQLLVRAQTLALSLLQLRTQTIQVIQTAAIKVVKTI